MNQQDFSRGNLAEVHTLLTRIKLPSALTRSQQLFNNAFLGHTSPGNGNSWLYDLRYEILESVASIGLLTDGTSSLSEVTYTIPFTLSDIKTGKILIKDQVSQRMTYTVSHTNPYATVVGREGIDEKAFVLLAQALHLKLAVALSGEPDSVLTSSPPEA